MRCNVQDCQFTDPKTKAQFDLRPLVARRAHIIRGKAKRARARACLCPPMCVRVCACARPSMCLQSVGVCIRVVCVHVRVCVHATDCTACNLRHAVSCYLTRYQHAVQSATRRNPHRAVQPAPCRATRTVPCNPHLSVQPAPCRATRTMPCTPHRAVQPAPCRARRTVPCNVPFARCDAVRQGLCASPEVPRGGARLRRLQDEELPIHRYCCEHPMSAPRAPPSVPP
jgi:hypothetical protein